MKKTMIVMLVLAFALGSVFTLASCAKKVGKVEEPVKTCCDNNRPGSASTRAHGSRGSEHKAGRRGNSHAGSGPGL